MGLGIETLKPGDRFHNGIVVVEVVRFEHFRWDPHGVPDAKDFKVIFYRGHGNTVVKKEIQSSYPDFLNQIMNNGWEKASG
jgi:hypothetical protein